MGYSFPETVMLYCRPTVADLELRLSLATMLLAGESIEACQRRVEDYTAPIAESLNATCARARADDTRWREWHVRYNALIELRGWLLQPVIEHSMRQPSPPIFIPRSDWERMRGKER